MPRRWRTIAVAVASLAYAVLLGFLTLQRALLRTSSAGRAQCSTISCSSESAWIFLRDTWDWMDVLLGAVLLAATVGFGMLVVRYLNRAWHWGAGLNVRHVMLWSIAISAYCALSLSWFGIMRDDPLIQLQAKEVHRNWQRSQNVLATVEALNGSSVQAAARLAKTVPARRPDIFLFEVESYGANFMGGRRLCGSAPGTDAARGARSWTTCNSRCSRGSRPLPAYGGGSWMSTASALSGMKIEAHSTYLAWKQLASRYPHLVTYLKQLGYYTLAISTWLAVQCGPLRLRPGARST